MSTVSSSPAAHDIRPFPGSDHITPYDRLVWTDDEIEQLLADGAQRPELKAFFGPAEYLELTELARAARSSAAVAAGSTSTGGLTRVIVVPGIMGSQLGLPRREPLPRDVLWLDPLDIGAGRLTELALPSAAKVLPYGAVLYSYLRFRLLLRAAGLDAVFHPYDWRRGIEELGEELAQRLQAEPSERLALVGHSLGGLVSRAALAHPAGCKVERLVLLGTPNRGSFGAVQALRGTYSVVRKIARLDARHSAEELASSIFITFPSLYQMLPPREGCDSFDLLDPAVWPESGPQPSRPLLESARSASRMMAQPDARYSAIVGVGQETVTAVARQQEEFVYTVTRHGDGTVPLPSARLEGIPTFHAVVSHSDLTRDPTVAAAVVDLIRTGTTRRLPSKWTTRSIAQAHVSDRELSARKTAKVDWARLTLDERRDFLQNLNEPTHLGLRIPARLGYKRVRA